MKASYNNALYKLQMIRTLQNNLPNKKQNKKDNLWSNVVEAKTIEIIKTNGLVKQMKLVIKIKNLDR